MCGKCGENNWVRMLLCNEGDNAIMNGSSRVKMIFRKPYMKESSYYKFTMNWKRKVYDSISSLNISNYIEKLFFKLK